MLKPNLHPLQCWENSISIIYMSCTYTRQLNVFIFCSQLIKPVVSELCHTKYYCYIYRSHGVREAGLSRSAWKQQVKLSLATNRFSTTWLVLVESGGSKAVITIQKTTRPRTGLMEKICTVVWHGEHTHPLSRPLSPCYCGKAQLRVTSRY